MFSPDASVPAHGHSLRPKRSRRAGSEESIKMPRAKRRRSALRKDTFEPLSDLSPNEVAAHVNGGPMMNGHAPEQKISRESTFSSFKDLTIRGATKKAEKRSERGNGTLTLSNNDFYRVEQLPTLPEKVRSQPTVSYTGALSSSHGYALALVPTEAWIWNYNTSSSTPSPNELFTLELPPATFPPSGSLPLGAFAANAIGSEPGLVVLAPDTGRVVYWEIISNASTLLSSEVSGGVKGMVTGMMSGESITDIVSAEPAGFILTFSHGRLAHLTVKDELGRPAIGVRFLRRNGGIGGGGLLENLRQYVGVERRKPVVAARAGRSTKGQRDVIIATEDGELEHWSTHLNFNDSLSYEISAGAELAEALSHHQRGQTKHDSGFRIVDLVLLDHTGNNVSPADTDNRSPYRLLFLVNMKSAYYLIEASISAKGLSVTVVHPISCYTAQTPEPGASTRSNTWRPRLCVPQPPNIAFIIFETAVAIYSLVKVEESPSSQLLMEGSSLPEPFQDCIKFQNDSIYRVLGFASENKHGSVQNQACVLTIQGFGLVRIASTISSATGDDFEEVKLSLKSKIEQAIFFGTIRQNPLDLAHTGGQIHSRDEVEDAALSICHEILSSTSKYIPKASPSLEQHLKLRAKALQDLTTHLQRHHGPISRSLKWKLLWGAEKLAAAQAMWKVHEEVIKRKSKDRKETYWDQLLFFMASEYRSQADKDKGESDWVRLWLIKDVYRIEKLLNWLFEGHQQAEKDRYLSDGNLIENVRESSDLWVAALDAAYRFREDNAPLYGLGDEIFDSQHSILKSGYKGLPESWTQEAKTVINGERLLQLVFKTTQDWWEASKTNEGGKINRKSLVHMAHALPKEVDFYLRMFKERQTWLVEQDHEDDPKHLDMAKKMITAGATKQQEYFYQVAGLGMVQEAITLAEEWSDMKALVELNLEAKRQLEQREQAGTSKTKQLEHEWRSIEERSEGYFSTYGAPWATAHFNKMVAEGELGSLLAEGQVDNKKKPYLTNYLRASPAFQKISWINDITSEGDFGQAERNLESLGMRKANDVWAQKTELCLAKLTRLAMLESGPTSEAPQPRTSTTKFDHRLALLNIQENLYAHILPIVRSAIDPTAAQAIALETFGQQVVGQKYPALRGMLNDGLGLLIRNSSMRPDRIVDVLTLMDPIVHDGLMEEEPGVRGHEFWLAMEAVRQGEVDAPLADALAHIIWRRAMIRDNWLTLNDTLDKNDDEVTATMTQSGLFLTLRDYFEHLGKHPDETHSIKLLSPSSIVNGVVFPQSLRERFHEAEIELVQRDLEAENELLRGYVEKGRLELHYGGLLKMAQGQAEAAADRAVEQVDDVVDDEV